MIFIRLYISLKYFSMKRLFQLLIIIQFIPLMSVSQPYQLESPDSKIVVLFSMQSDQPYYSIRKGGQTILASSRLGLKLDHRYSGKFKVTDHSTQVIDEQYETLWWKNKFVKNQAREMTIGMEEIGSEKKKLNIIFRVYNDGVAFRYEIPEQEYMTEYVIEEDLSEFAFDDDYLWWSANGERDNLGPISLNILSDAVFTPVVLKLAEDSYVSIQEAAIYDFANFKIKKSRGNTLQPDVQGASKGKTGMKTSWRAILIGKNAGDLLESNMLINLNPPCKIEDTSWIRFGRTMWDWRAWGYTAPDGFTYGLNTPSHKRFIDFAAENNIQSLLMDADWYGPEFSEESDPTKANNAIDIEENMRYAREKGIGIILYLNDVGARKFGLERVLKQFHDWGASGIKYGFMKAQGQEKVLYTRKVVALCAQYKLTVNFHDNPIPPSGDERTWPNVLTREYCHSQADAKYSYYPETVVSSAYINLLSGPVDMCNGWYAFDNAESRPKGFKFLPGTVAAKNAKLGVIFSGMSVLPDAPEAYKEKPDLFDFIKSLPTSFDEYKVLGGDIESYISVARRSGDNWYIGSLTTREARKITLELDFLEAGAKYTAYLFEDTPDTHFIDNREAYATRTLQVDSETSLTLSMASGGGNAVRIEKID